MEIDKGIVTRALQKAGQEPLTDEEIEKNSTRYRAITSFYLSTIEETLSTTEWTSQKTRKRLSRAEIENFSNYDYVYSLPIDCAKAEELLSKEEFIIEGRFLYTNSADAVLMYVSNHRHNFFHFELDAEGNLYAVNEKDGDNTKHFELDENGDLYAIDIVDDEFEKEISDTDDEGRETGTTHKEIILPEDYERDFKAEKNSVKGGIDISYKCNEDGEFRADYNNITDDPLLTQYIETRLASKIALKITGDKGLYQTLYNEAQMAEARAVDVTLIHSKSRRNGNEYWTERLGLSDI